jgi:hypothetical protein
VYSISDSDISENEEKQEDDHDDRLTRAIGKEEKYNLILTHDANRLGWSDKYKDLMKKRVKLLLYVRNKKKDQEHETLQEYDQVTELSFSAREKCLQGRLGEFPFLNNHLNRYTREIHWYCTYLDNMVADMDLEIDQKLATRHLKQTDLQTLGNEQLVNDEIINSYMSLLELQDSSIKAISTFFYYNLNKKSPNLESARNLFPITHLYTYKLIMIPICDYRHWRLALINIHVHQNNSDVLNLNISLLDSLRKMGKGEKNNHTLKLIVDFLTAYDSQLNEKWIISTYDEPNVPQQDNVTDCGVFVLVNAKRSCNKMDRGFPSPTQLEMNQHRKTIRRELSNSKLEE